MAFGLRNVTDIKQTLKSIIGCLKPGGKLIVLEFSISSLIKENDALGAPVFYQISYYF